MKQRWMKIIFLAISILILILDAKTVTTAVSEGIDLCVRVVIPALFPFLMLSIPLTGSLSETNLPTKRYIFLLGLLGGYPTGAKCIADASKARQISRDEAQYLIAFCNNAGPAFIFGIGAVLFEEIRICFLVWAIHILSALCVSLLTGGKVTAKRAKRQTVHITLSNALKQAIETMAMICGWVILFRILFTILSRWVLWVFPSTLQTVLFGLFELSNGCNLLESIQPAGLRFILFSLFLGFGGLCVTMQTMSVLSSCGISIKYYLTGKITQTAISCLLADTAQYLLFSGETFTMHPFTKVLSLVTVIFMTLLTKKPKFPVAFRKGMMYNIGIKYMNNVMKR